MNLYIYSDESGTFDKEHNKYFVFAGLIFTSFQDKEDNNRKYLNVEKTIRSIENISFDSEVKASNITNKSKSKIFRSLNNCEKFCVVVKQQLVNDTVFKSKKTKQRYLDWAYKRAIKEKLIQMQNDGKIDLKEVYNIYFFVDEHTTATDGIYELRESIEQEFKVGVINFENNSSFPPICENLQSVNIKFCNSSKYALIRASDIIANKIYYYSLNDFSRIYTIKNINVFTHP